MKITLLFTYGLLVAGTFFNGNTVAPAAVRHSIVTNHSGYNDTRIISDYILSRQRRLEPSFSNLVIREISPEGMKFVVLYTYTYADRVSNQTHNGVGLSRLIYKHDGTLKYDFGMRRGLLTQEKLHIFVTGDGNPTDSTKQYVFGVIRDQSIKRVRLNIKGQSPRYIVPRIDTIIASFTNLDIRKLMSADGLSTSGEIIASQKFND